MKKLAVALFALAGGLLIAPSPVAAHHSAAMFDETKRVEVKGTVVQWVWANPHCLLQFEAKGEDGPTVRWVGETSNPLDMTNRGWRRGDFKAGDVVTVALRNFVTALSTFGPVIISPPSKSGFVALNQFLEDLGALLRTTERTLPTFETLIMTPSTFPTSFLPPKVSLLDPTTVMDPSACLTTDSKTVNSVPTTIGLAIAPARSALIIVPELPTAVIPFLSTAKAFINTGELSCNVY